MRRIGYSGTPGVNISTLTTLQTQHLLSVPFENLDIHYGRKIVLNFEALYRKIVSEMRGGFCYELNGLFYYLLNELGYDAKMVSARVHSENGRYSPEYDHMAIVVKIDQQEYLVDVGFGRFSLATLPIVFEQQIKDKQGVFYFDKYDDQYIRISSVKEGKLVPQYMFKNQAKKLEEFQDRCEYQQKSNDSHFTQKKMISIPTNEGRITLNDQQIKITTGDSVYEINFDEVKFDEYLQRYFGITISWDNVAVI